MAPTVMRRCAPKPIERERSLCGEVRAGRQSLDYLPALLRGHS